VKKTNIATLRNNLSELLEYVQKGRELQIEKRNIPIAKIVPITAPHENRTKLGAGKGSVEFKGDITSPVMEEDWEMLK
jgi:prevent-host-death family protein